MADNVLGTLYGVRPPPKEDPAPKKKGPITAPAPKGYVPPKPTPNGYMPGPSTRPGYPDSMNGPFGVPGAVPGGKTPEQIAADAAAAAAAETKAAAQADALATLKMMLDQWGLGELTQTVIGYIQQGYGVNQVLLELRNSDAYKKRFSGNQERLKRGYAALDPGDYLALEDAYQRIMVSAGLPKGFWDDNADFAKLIGGNVSATEVQWRVDQASKAVNNSDPNYLAALRQAGFGDGDLTANLLDPDRAMPILRRQIGKAHLGAASMGAGLGFDPNRANTLYDQIADAGGDIDEQFARRGYTAVAAALPGADRLSRIHGGDDVGQDTLEDEFLGGSELASQKRKRLAQRELVAFQGSGGVRKDSLQNKGRGEY